MILAGALGNLVDRLFIGKVRDFVEIVFFGCDVPLLGESFAIFNIADAALVVGVILFLVYFIFMYREPKDEDEEAAPDVELYEDAEGGDDGDSAAPRRSGRLGYAGNCGRRGADVRRGAGRIGSVGRRRGRGYETG